VICMRPETRLKDQNRDPNIPFFAKRNSTAISSKHTLIIAVPPHICTCAELGCGSESFALDGVITIGRMRTSHNGKIHEAELRRLRHESGDGTSLSLLEDTLPMNVCALPSLLSWDLRLFNLYHSFLGKLYNRGVADLPALVIYVYRDVPRSANQLRRLGGVHCQLLLDRHLFFLQNNIDYQTYFFKSRPA
jgi:hypothetical protein